MTSSFGVHYLNQQIERSCILAKCNGIKKSKQDRESLLNPISNGIPQNENPTDFIDCT